MIRLLAGDCRDVLPTLPAESVQCVVTSPPYYGLRDYGTALWDGGDAGCEHAQGKSRNDGSNGRHNSAVFHGSMSTEHGGGTAQYRDTCGKCGAVRVDRQIGLEASPDEYLATMVGVFREVRRVLRRDGVCFTNMGDSYAGSQRATAYGTADTEPASSTGDGCLCGSLCDGCRKAYRIGRFHSDGQPVPTPVVSSVSSILEHKSEKRGRVPTSDFPHRRDHSLGAMRDPAPTSCRAIELLHDALASTTTECETPPRDECLRTDTDYVCLSCGCSLAGCVLASADTTVSLSELRSVSDAMHRHGMSTDGTASTDGSSPARTSDTACDYCAYRQSTITSHPKAKPKDLLLMPARLALALQADGWWVRSDIIWSKPNPMPESVTDRPTSAHEHVFMLTKAPRYYYDADAVREPFDCSGDVRVNTQYWQDTGKTSSSAYRKPLEHSGRNLRNVWTIATHAYSAAHFATFPPELAERCIKAGTSERGCCAACGKPWVRVTEYGKAVPLTPSDAGRKATWTIGDAARDPDSRTDTPLPRHYRPVVSSGWSPGCQCNADVVPCTVLDPFIGAGTTALVADRLQRDCIGIDLNVSYTEMAMERCRQDAPLFTAFPPAEPPEDARMADLFTDMAPD